MAMRQQTAHDIAEEEVKRYCKECKIELLSPSAVKEVMRSVTQGAHPEKIREQVRYAVFNNLPAEKKIELEIAYHERQGIRLKDIGNALRERAKKGGYASAHEALETLVSIRQKVPTRNEKILGMSEAQVRSYANQLYSLGRRVINALYSAQQTGSPTEYAAYQKEAQEAYKKWKGCARLLGIRGPLDKTMLPVKERKTTELENQMAVVRFVGDLFSPIFAKQYREKNDRENAAYFEDEAGHYARYFTGIQKERVRVFFHPEMSEYLAREYRKMAKPLRLAAK